MLISNVVLKKNLKFDFNLKIATNIVCAKNEPKCKRQAMLNGNKYAINDVIKC